MIQASCHCGAVELRIVRRPSRLTECNCSICRRYGARWAYYTRRSVDVARGRSVLKSYRWGDRTIRFMHCARCGCLTHYETDDRTASGRFAVNARMMAPEDVAGARIRLFDGADSWRYL